MRRLKLGMMAGGIPITDPDAIAFLAAAGITNPTISTAIDTLVIQLKAIGVWSQLKAIYPFVGGTATTHKFNLKDPQDTNAAFRLVFSGGWTHSANGVLPNGSNSWAETFLIPNTTMPTGGDHLAYYSRTNSANSIDYLIGVETGSPLTLLGLVGKRTTAGRGFYVTTNPSSTFNTARQDDLGRDTRGFFLGTSFGLNTIYTLNGITLATNTVSNIYLTRATDSLPIAASKNNGLIVNYTDKECALASIGLELTPTEAANYYTAVQAFQTTLNRQV